MRSNDAVNKIRGSPGQPGRGKRADGKTRNVLLRRLCVCVPNFGIQKGVQAKSVPALYSDRRTTGTIGGCDREHGHARARVWRARANARKNRRARARARRRVARARERTHKQANRPSLEISRRNPKDEGLRVSSRLKRTHYLDMPSGAMTMIPVGVKSCEV